MSNLDLKLKLLAGEPIEVDKSIGCIRPLTLREIVNYGYTEYLKRLNILALEMDDLIGEEELDGNNLQISLFDLLVIHGGESIERELEKSIEFFLNEKTRVISKAKVIVVGEGDDPKIINRENFDKVREVIKWQNGINKFSNNGDANPSSSETQKVMKRLEESRKMAMKAKGENEDDEIDFSNIVSSVSNKSNSINKLNIFDLTIFQLYDDFKRLDLIDQYDINIKSMLAGAKDVKLKHWSGKLD